MGDSGEYPAVAVVSVSGFQASDVKRITAQAEAGDAEAIHTLATWQMTGLEGLVEKDAAAGLANLARASELGAAYASYSLGTIYERGEKVPKSYAKAFEYFTLAFAQGAEEAAEEIYRFYYYGLGVEQNEHLAAAWQKIADEAARKLNLSGAAE